MVIADTVPSLQSVTLSTTLAIVRRPTACPTV